MRKLLIIPLLFLTLFASAQFTHSGGMFLRSGFSFMSAPSVPPPPDPAIAIINDGNTVGWYIASETGASYMTKDAQDSVSVWKDYLGSGRNLLATDNTKRSPHWSSTGILFDGSFSTMSASFTLIQPVTYYLVVKVATWDDLRTICDGYNYQSCYVYMNPTTPSIKASSVAAESDASTDLAVGTWGVIQVVSNGAASKFRVDDHTDLTWNDGAYTMGGFSLGSNYYAGGTFYPSNIEVKEVIVRKITDSTGDRATIYSYFVTKYGLNMWLILLLIPLIFPRYKRKFDESIKMAA